MGYTKVMSFELNGVQIKTTVSDEVKVIDEHISSFLQPTDNHRTKVIGFDTERRPPFKGEPGTFQLCDGNSCLIFHSHTGYRIPLSLSNFLCQPNFTFVGFGIKNSFDYLEKRCGNGFKNAVELGTLAATLMDEPYLSFCGVDELAFVVNKLDLRKYRPLNLAFDSDSYPLSEELAKLATVNVYSYHKIGSALFERYSRDKTQKDSNGSEVTEKKYSRDFLLKFSQQSSVLPEGFDTIEYIAEALIMGSNIGSHQGGMQRNSPDGERWQCAANFQRGLIPSPSSQSPLQMMHKAEKKYEEQAKQRQLKGILNKLTPLNFEKLFEQVKAVNIDNVVTLTGVISQIFEKALMEPTFCEMYANFCFHLADALPDLGQDNEKLTFKRLLVNKCQEEFERGEREQEEANKADEERESKRSKARRRMLGNIRLIGELYKKKMLTERIMHECIKKLLGQCQNPDEEDIEALCKLMSTIGEMIDHPKAKEHMDVYFERIKSLSNNMILSSRVRIMLKDTIDLRKNRWQQRRKVEGPKTIEEVHRDASQERHSQAGRMGHGMGITIRSPRRNPMDFGSRGSCLVSPRWYGSQDVKGNLWSQ